MQNLERGRTKIRAIPAVVGRFRRKAGETASIAILPLRRDATLLWWINSRLEGTRYCTTLADAVNAAAHVHVRLVEEGWSDGAPVRKKIAARGH